MIASVKSHQATVNLVMRSVLQTRTQPTQHYCCPLYRLELNYTYWLHQLCGPSCHGLPPRVYAQGACPSTSLGCRKIASLSIAQMTCLSVDNVTLYMLRIANSALSFSLILSNSPHFLELHYWALVGHGFIHLSCSVSALLNNMVCSCPTRQITHSKRGNSMRTLLLSKRATPEVECKLIYQHGHTRLHHK